MKKRNLILIISILALVWLVGYYTIIIKIPYYLYINCIQLPEDTVNIQTKVGISDIEGWHIIADRLIYSVYSEDELEQYIDKNNDTSAYVINYFEHIPGEGDYLYIISDEHPEVTEAEQPHYFLLHYSSPHYFTLSWDGILECFGLVSTVAICILLYRILKKFVK